MFHWLIIILGILIISLSISNPIFKLVLITNLKFKSILILIPIRIFLFLLGIIVIIIGLYVESII